jgi:hypothetical protein
MIRLLMYEPHRITIRGLQLFRRGEDRSSESFDIVGIEAGEAVNKAGKKLVCKGAKCIVYGMNRTTIPNGPIAVVKINVDQSSAGGGRPTPLKHQAHGRARTTKPEIQIGDVVAVSLDTKGITVVPGTSSEPIR